MTSKNIFLDNFVELFNSQKFSDFEITVKNEVFAAHKFVLFLRNKFFARMFSNESSEAYSMKISISDIEPADFKVFLKYLYTTKFEPEDININLLKIAHKYMDDELKAICEAKLGQTITIQNVVKLFTLAVENNCENLSKSTSNWIAANYESVKDLEDFQSISQHPNGCVEIFNAFHCNTNFVHRVDKKLPDSFANLFNSSTCSDLTIIVKNKEFQVHKSILFARNKVFATLFKDDSSKSKNICIPDFEPEDFEVFLKYLYTTEYKPKDVNKNLLRIAHKYLDDELKMACGKILSQRLNKENVIELFILALENECANLKTSATNWIVTNYESVKDLKDFGSVLQYPNGLAEIIDAFNSKRIEIPSYSKRICSFDFDISGDCSVHRYSSIFIVDSVKWKMSICNKRDQLTVYLYNHKRNTSEYCQVACEFRLVSQIKGKSTSKQFIKMFKNNINSWGFSKFLPWEKLTDPSQGFVKDDTVIVYVILEVLKRGKIIDLNSD